MSFPKPPKSLRALAVFYTPTTKVFQPITRQRCDGHEVEQPKCAAALINLTRDTHGIVRVLVATHFGESRLLVTQVADLYRCYLKDAELAQMNQFRGVGTGSDISYYESQDGGKTFIFEAYAGDFFPIKVANGLECVARLYMPSAVVLHYFDNECKFWKLVVLDSHTKNALIALFKHGNRVFGSHPIEFTGKNGVVHASMLTSFDSGIGIILAFESVQGVMKAVFLGEFETGHSVVIGAGLCVEHGTTVTAKEMMRNVSVPYIKVTETPTAVIMALLNTAMTTMQS